jgi:hypothetical protein
MGTEEIYRRLSAIEEALTMMQQIMDNVCKIIETQLYEKQKLVQEKIKQQQKKKNR